MVSRYVYRYNKYENKRIFFNFNKLYQKRFYSTINKVYYYNRLIIFRDEALFESTVGMTLSSEIRKSITFSYSSKIFSQIIGHLLGDGSLTLTWSSKNPYFVFTQSFLKFNYA